MAHEAFLHNHCRYLFSIQANYSFGNANNFPSPTLPPFKCFPKFTKNNNSARFRTVRKSSTNRNPSTNGEKPKARVSDDRTRTPDEDLDPDPASVSNSISLFLRRISEEFKLDGLGMQIMSIALPAALALAADPITSLVDTAFVGHLGSAELAAVGVSGAVFNLVSKLFNVPLLNITTSFVAEEQALVAKSADDPGQADRSTLSHSKIILPSVSTSLMLAAALGIVEAVALFAGSSILMDTMGFANARAS